MTILWIAPDVPYPPNSGGNVLVYNRMREMRRRGHKMLLLAFGKPHERTEAVLKPLREICEEVIVYPKRPIRRALLDYPRSNLPLRVLTRPAKRLASDVRRMLTQYSIDAIQAENSILAESFPVLDARRDATLFLTFQSLVYEEAERIAARLPVWSLKKPVFRREAIRARRFELGIFQRDEFDRYLFVSDTELERVASLFPESRDKFVHVPIGINLEQYSGPEMAGVVRCGLHKGQPGKNILFVGGFENPANLDAAHWFAHRVFPLVLRECPETRFVIVGRNAERHARSFASAHVDVLSDVAEVKPHLLCADVCVMPIRAGGGVRVKLLEAVAARRIVVSTRAALEGTCFVPQKHLLTADHEAEFAARCVEALRNPGAFRAMNENALELLRQRHSWVAVGDQLEDLYLDRLAATRRRRA